MSRTATLCTRPAESFGRTLRHSTGESLKPTRRSSTRRACCASTRWRSMLRGFSMAARMAGLVISWNTMRREFFGSSLSTSARCQAMASPSRSSSDASHTASAFLACARSSLTTRVLSAGISYSGSKVVRFTPKSFFLRSRMWPKLDSTLKSFPRNFSMVLALAGDSTITRFFCIRHAVFWGTKVVQGECKAKFICAFPSCSLPWAKRMHSQSVQGECKAKFICALQNNACLSTDFPQCL